MSHYRITLLGDTQRTHWIERLMGRKQNAGVAEKIFKEIATQKPDALFLLGDLVCVGSSQEDWRWYDSIFLPIKNNKITTHAIWGNHDLLWFKSESKKNAIQRFECLKDSFYTRTFGLLKIISLNTCKPQMSKQEWLDQLHWLKNEITKTDEDKTIKRFVILGHHPAYTNSIGLGSNDWVKDELLSIAVSSPKFLTYFSGHAHTYEKIKVKNHLYFVSGGGGGPQRKLKKISSYNDLFNGGESRPFHFLNLELNDSQLIIHAMALNNAKNSFSLLDKTTIEL